MSGEEFDFPDELVDLDPVSSHPNLLVFSRPKAGKTTFATSDDNILLINCEVEGELSAARAITTGKNVKQWPVRSYEDFEKALEWLKECVRTKGRIPFEWVVVDTVTTLQDRQIMRHVMDKMLKRRPDRNAYIPDKAEWFESQLMLVQKVKELCDLPVKTVLLAHVMEVEDHEGVMFYYPQLQGGKFRVAQQVLSFVTSYGFMYTQTRKKDGKIVTRNGKRLRDRIIQWEDTEGENGATLGGDRTGVLGERTRNITLRQIRERMEQENAKFQAAQQESKEEGS